MVSDPPRACCGPEVRWSGVAATSAAGKYTRTRVPLPGSLSTSIEPPCCRTNPYTVARPSPVPLPTGFVVKNGSKRSEEHTSELQSQSNLVCRLLLEKKKKRNT